MKRAFGIFATLLGIAVGSISIFLYSEMTTLAVHGEIAIPHNSGIAIVFAMIWAAAVFLTCGGIVTATE